MGVGRRAVLASALAAIAAPALLRRSLADTPIALTLHHFMSSVSSGHDKFLSPWARKIEAESGGRIRINVFPSMQLGGKPAQLFDQARDGVVDIAWVAPSLTPGRFPKLELFDLPFVSARRALVSSKALQDFAAVNLKDEFREVRALSFCCTDRGVLHTNQPVRSIEDLKGLKFHVPTRLAGEAMRALGGEPVPMPFGQIPVAITAGVVDGCLDPWHLVPTLRLNDLLHAHTEFADLSASSTSFVLVMNADAYDRLPRELKIVIDNNSGQVAAELAGAMWDLQAAAIAEMVAERGDTIVTLLPEAVAHWRKATEPVVAAWLKGMKEQKVDGAKLLGIARALMVKYTNLPEPQPAQPSAQADQANSGPARSDAKPETATPAKPATAAAPSPSPVPAAKPATTAAPSPPAAPTKPATAAGPSAAPAKPATTAAPSPAPAAKPVIPSSAAAKPALQPAPQVATRAAAPAQSAVPARPPVGKPLAPSAASPAPPAASAASAASAPVPPPPTAAAAPGVPPPPAPTAAPAPMPKPLPKSLDIPL